MNFGGGVNNQRQQLEQAVQEMQMRDMFTQYNSLVGFAGNKSLIF